jgi:endogenous inhibitor of DNA gyrase (YacG/DUF329 family)
MAKKRVRSLRCPTCRKLVLREEAEFPFCSERCRLIDLGKWASGGYVISTPLHQSDQFGDADYTLNQRRPRPDGSAQDHDHDRKRS